MSVLDVRDLTVRYGNGPVAAVQNVSFSIEKASCVALIGPNGAGKSTVLSALAGDATVLPFTSGSVLVDGRDIAKLPAHRRARLGVARTYQVARSFKTMSVGENLALGSFAHRRPSLSWLGSFRGHTKPPADFSEFEMRHTKRPGELSQGDVKLLELAMAVSPNPRLLLLDEATAGMARSETRSIIEMLRHFRKSRPDLTVVLVEHDMDLVFGVADRIIVLHHGEIVADGTPEEIQKDETVRSVYLGKRPGTAAEKAHD
jgi:ABC-type branched-subunit amino acid transport system ATPase component